MAKTNVPVFTRRGIPLGTAVIDDEKDDIVIKDVGIMVIDEIMKLIRFQFISHMVFDIVPIEAISGESRLGETNG